LVGKRRKETREEGEKETRNKGKMKETRKIGGKTLEKEKRNKGKEEKQERKTEGRKALKHFY
jgi:hypothetical protein